MRVKVSPLLKCSMSLLVLWLAACNQLTMCTTEVVPGLTILVTDSVTGAALGAPDTEVVVRDGAYVETARLFSGAFFAADERAGGYSVTVSRTGYREWTRTGIGVRRQGCHVERVNVSARLQALQ